MIDKIFNTDSDLLELLAATVDDVFWVADWELRSTLYVSPAYERIWQNTRESLRTDPRSFIERIHPDDRERMKDALLIQRQGKPFSHEYRLLLSDGEVRWIWDIGFPVHDRQGKPWVYAGVAKDITERKRIEHELAKSQQHLKELSYRREVIREEEIRRIAQDIHDELGQRLTALKMGLSYAKHTFKDAPGSGEILEKLLAQTDGAIAAIRDLSSNLRPASLDLGLLPALRWLVARFEQESGLSCELRCDPDEIAIPEPLATQVFRVVQESLTNAARHAAARTVGIRLALGTGTLNATIRDDGRGFDVSEAIARSNCRGLRGMRERAELLGGTIEIESRAGEGTSIRCSFPVTNQADLR